MKNITKESLGFKKTKKLVLITSGSLGSNVLNDKLVDYLNDIKDYEVLMITGENNYEEILTKVKNKNVKLLPYLEGQAGLLKNVDIIKVSTFLLSYYTNCYKY